MTSVVAAPNASQACSATVITPKKNRDKFRQILLITVIVLEVLLFLAAVAFGTAAIVTGLHLLWIGVIPCALAMIALLGGLLCALTPSKRNDWTFQRLPEDPYARIKLYDQRRTRSPLSGWR